MTIKRIVIKNWRSIGENPGISLNLGRINVLAGVNDSGKTAILLATYGAICTRIHNNKDTYLKKYLHIEGSKHDDNRSDTRADLKIRIFLTLPPPHFEKIISFSQKIINEACEIQEIQEELLNIISRNIKVSFEMKSFNESPYSNSWDIYLDDAEDEINRLLQNKYNYSTEQISELQKTLNSIRYNMYSFDLDFYVNSFYITPHRQYNLGINTDSNSIEDIENVELGYEPSELVQFIQKIKTERMKRRGKYDELLRYVRILFPEITSIEINIPEGANSQDVYIEWSINGRYKNQPLSRSGTGIISAVYLASRLLSEARNSVIGFIDEPETGLHPKLQVRFLKLLRELSNDFNIQWMLTTHSPFIMKNLKEEDRLFLVEHDGIETRTRDIEPENKSIVFQALGAYLPDTITSKGFVFVEGATESNILPILLSKCGFDLDEQGLVIIPMGGDNLFCIQPSDLKKIHPKVMVILDSDLHKPISSGGNIVTKKLEYEVACKNSDVHLLLPRDFRTLENMYPKTILAKILNISLEELTYGNFDEVKEIPDNSKLIIGKRVAYEMSEDQAKEFPLVKEILKWWD